MIDIDELVTAALALQAANPDVTVRRRAGHALASDHRDANAVTLIRGGCAHDDGIGRELDELDGLAKPLNDIGEAQVYALAGLEQLGASLARERLDHQVARSDHGSVSRHGGRASPVWLVRLRLMCATAHSAGVMPSGTRPRS